MNASLIMTIIGSDRPGLVDEIAQAIVAQGGNWVESRMAHLGGQFAGILQVEVPSERCAALVEDLRALEQHGLTLVIHPDQSPDEHPRRQTAYLEIVGQDRPGIVREVSQILASMSINVEELNTECVAAPNSGQTLFQATARLGLPPSLELSLFRQQLEKLAGDVMVEIQLETVDSEQPES